MGKSLLQQRRGKGGPRFRAPSFNYKGEAKHRHISEASGKVIDIVKCRGHSAPLAVVEYTDGMINLSIAPTGVKVGDEISQGANAEAKVANTLSLKNIPEGTLIYNIESQPGDGGKFVRTGGSAAKVISKTETKIVVEFPSKKKKIFNPNCRATIGTIAGGGRLEKPMLKAGNKFFAMKAKNKFWPKMSATSLNAVQHPYGGGRSSKKNMPYTTSRNAPAGRKVGRIAAKRTGRKK